MPGNLACEGEGLRVEARRSKAIEALLGTLGE